MEQLPLQIEVRGMIILFYAQKARKKVNKSNKNSNTNKKKLRQHGT